MPDCPNVIMRELLPDYLHGSLDAADRRTVEEHVADCSDCADELHLLRSVRESAVLSAPTFDISAILRAIPKPPRPLPRPAPVRADMPARRLMPAWIGLAAALTIAVIGSWAAGVGRPDAATGPDTLAVAQPADGGARAGEARELAVSFGGGVTDLSDADVIALLDEVEELEPVPPAEPDPVWGTLRGVGGP